MSLYLKKFLDCSHKNTVIDEPHLAGARKCVDCGAHKMSSSSDFKIHTIATSIGVARAATLEAEIAVLKTKIEIAKNALEKIQDDDDNILQTMLAASKALREIEE